MKIIVIRALMINVVIVIYFLNKLLLDLNLFDSITIFLQIYQITIWGLARQTDLNIRNYLDDIRINNNH